MITAEILDAVRQHIERKCELMDQKKVEGMHNLSFVIARFKEIDKTKFLGVRMGAYPGNPVSMTGLLAETRKPSFVDKFIGIEVPGRIDDAGDVRWIAELTYNACVAFVAFKGHESVGADGEKVISVDVENDKAIIARINPDKTYQFKDIVIDAGATQCEMPTLGKNNKVAAEIAAPAIGEGADADMTGGAVQEGCVYAYLGHQGYGFLRVGSIVGVNEWWFHISSVSDTLLADKLNNLRQEDYAVGYDLKTQIGVQFQDGGVKPGKKYRQAVNIRLSKAGL